MNPNLHIDQSVLHILYIKYKAYLLPLGVIILCVILFFAVVLPQFQAYFASREEVTADETQIEHLNQNIGTVQLLNTQEITKNLDIAVAALPSEKDYAGILNAISDAASIANVSIGDYSFQIGDIFSKQPTSAGNGQLPVDISLTISGSVDDAQNFMIALSKEFPLSEVISISNRGGGGSEIKATFFYNPLPPIQFNPASSLQQLSIPQQKLMSSLAKDFRRPQDVPIPKKQVATESAQPQQ